MLNGRQCCMPGCEAATSGYGSECGKHRERKRRHGHPAQEGVKVTELKPFMKPIKLMLKQAPKVLPAVEAQWKALVSEAQAELALRKSGRATNDRVRDACREVIKLSEQVQFEDILVTGLATFLLAEVNPARFKSDKGFIYQLVRKVRCLGYVNAGTYYDNRRGSQMSFYRDMRPQTTELFGAMLLRVLARPAAHVITRHRNEAQRVAAVDAAFAEVSA